MKIGTDKMTIDPAVLGLLLSADFLGGGVGDFVQTSKTGSLACEVHILKRLGVSGNTGPMQRGDVWRPATGEIALVTAVDHVAVAVKAAAKLARALAEFDVDPERNRIAEAFMARTAPAATKRPLARK